MPHVVILCHRHEHFEWEPYFLREVAVAWRERGVRVTVQRGPGRRVEDADLAIVHVDLTVVPPDHLAAAREYPVALNAGVDDISKRRISRHLVRRGDGYEGPVIVKTDRNSGGLREGMLDAKTSRLRRVVGRVRERLPWTCRARLSTTDYPIFDGPARVPRAVWLNPDLVVERFLPERRDGLYCLRTWVFLGDRETNSLSYAREPVIKSHNVVRREAVPEVPEELRRIRRELAFDFGKFDYGIVDGRVVLYDANRTPTLGAIPKEQYWPRIQLLAEGIGAYLEGARA